MDEFIESLRVRLSSLSYKQLQKEAKENSISARQKKVQIIEALVKKHSRNYNAVLNHSNSDDHVEAAVKQESFENVLTEVGNSENQENISAKTPNSEDRGNICIDDHVEAAVKQESFENVLTEVSNSENQENVSAKTPNSEDRSNFCIDDHVEQESENILTEVSNSENQDISAKTANSEDRSNFCIDLDIGCKTPSVYTPTKARLSYTPYRGTFRYVDTTKMSNREFKIYKQKMEEEKKQMLNE